MIGFSHTHLSGTGIGDLFGNDGHAVTGDVTYARGVRRQTPASGLWSYADRTQEIARPGYYSVPLTRQWHRAELGLHGYTFPASDAAAVVFDLENGGCWDKATETHLAKEGEGTVTGWRHSTGWAKDQRVYFAAEFSKPFEKFETIGDNYAGFVPYNRRGTSVAEKSRFIARKRRGCESEPAAELSGWDFDATAKAATRRVER